MKTDREMREIKMSGLRDRLMTMEGKTVRPGLSVVDLRDELLDLVDVVRDMNASMGDND